MANFLDSVCKRCRREGMKLFLKGERCFTEKCSFERRAYAPGQHGQRRSKLSEYGTQLREKQRAKHTYGVLERQFRKYFHQADRMKGITGQNLLQLLECRLDNMAFRLGFAASRKAARQLVRHNHLTVNGKKVNIPSYLVKQDDVLAIVEASQKIPAVLASIESAKQRGIPEWLSLDDAKFTGKVNAIPSVEQIALPIQEQLIVELYSK